MKIKIKKDNLISLIEETKAYSCLESFCSDIILSFYFEVEGEIERKDFSHELEYREKMSNMSDEQLQEYSELCSEVLSTIWCVLLQNKQGITTSLS